MTREAILAACRFACRLVNDTLDEEINELIDSALYDLEISGVANENDEPYTLETADQLVITAIKTYVKLNLGDLISDVNYWTRLKASYDEQKAQLATCTGFTNWG